MKQYTPRRNIERATRFRVDYVCYLDDAREVVNREFSNTKSLEQWVARNDNDSTLGILILKRQALICDVWEPYTTIGKKTITLHDLKNIVRDLEDETLKPSKIGN